MSMQKKVPYLNQVRFRPKVEPTNEFPLHFEWLQELDYSFKHPVTFFVGENGSGKSTLIEAIAWLCNLPVSGGSVNDTADSHGPESTSPLAEHLQCAFHKTPRDGYFLRAEFHSHFATLLETRAADPDFIGDPYAAYGGKSLHTVSHGEAFLTLMNSRLRSGLILMDEPESALSPKRQLTLLALIADRVANENAQFIIATHSPILLTYPNAKILSFDNGPLDEVQLRDTSHFQITQGILESPERYWRHLRADEPDS